MRSRPRTSRVAAESGAPPNNHADRRNTEQDEGGGFWDARGGGRDEAFGNAFRGLEIADDGVGIEHRERVDQHGPGDRKCRDGATDIDEPLPCHAVVADDVARIVSVGNVGGEAAGRGEGIKSVSAAVGEAEGIARRIVILANYLAAVGDRNGIGLRGAGYGEGVEGAATVDEGENLAGARLAGSDDGAAAVDGGRDRQGRARCVENLGCAAVIEKP